MREINFNKKLCLIPEIIQIGWGVFTEHITGFPPHVHQNTFEICYMSKGNWDWWVENDLFELETGQIFMTRPGEIHGGLNNMIYPSEFYWLQVALPENGQLPCMDPQETRQLTKQYFTIDTKVFKAAPEVPIYFKNLLQEHQLPTPYSKTVVRANLANLLVTVLQSGLNPDCVRQNNLPSQLIRDATQYINSRLEQSPKVEDVANHLNLSLTAFKNKFQQETGINPKQYIMQRKIHYAKLLLMQQDKSITDIAYRMGFSSSQYFATVFKHACGFSPREYQQKANRSYQSTQILDMTQK